MFLIVFIALLLIPQTRKYIIGFVVIIGICVLLGAIAPDFFLEEPLFWTGILIVIACIVMLASYIRDWDQKDREDRYKYL